MEDVDLIVDDNFRENTKEAMLTSLSFEGGMPVDQSIRGILISKMTQIADRYNLYPHTEICTREVIMKLLQIVKQPIESCLYWNHLKLLSPEHDESKPRSLSEDLVNNTCVLLCSIIQELVSQSLGIGSDLLSSPTRSSQNGPLLATPSRFTKVSSNRTWNTGNGSPEAIAFTVDQSVMIIGVTLFGGSPGSATDWSYELELLDSQQSSSTSKVQVYDRIPDPFGFDQFFDDMDGFVIKDRGEIGKHPISTQFRVVETVKGTYSIPVPVSDSPVDDSQHVTEVKFDRPVQLFPNIKYALRLRNNGPRTSNGDQGVSSVRGPDGTIFCFSDCPLSYNGTNHSRGQFANILYYSTTDNKKFGANDPLEAGSFRQNYEQKIVKRNLLSISKSVIQAVIDLLEQSIDDGSFTDTIILDALANSAFMSRLLPTLCSSLIPVVKSDPKSAVSVILLIKNLLPVISSINKAYVSDVSSLITTTRHTVIVESDHPYKPAGVTHQRVSFPSYVRWISLEFDKRSATAQPEDYLQLYIPSVSRVKLKTKEHPMKKDDSQNDENEDVIVSTQEQTNDFIPIFKKFSGSHDKGNWPLKTIILPGNEVVFSMETASDYIKSENKSTYFGFRCQISGYDLPPEQPSISGEESFCLLEQEISYLAATAMSSLLSRSLILPNDESTEISLDHQRLLTDTFARHKELLSKGLSLSQVPSPDEALEFNSLPLANEKPFLKDFVNCTPGTPGGRLAKWLQPESFVDPSKCTVQAVEKATCGSAALITITMKDQYNEVVNVPGLKVQVVIQPLEATVDDPEQDSKGNHEQMPRIKASKRKAGGYDHDSISSTIPSTKDIPYSVTIKDKMRYHAISMMPEFQSYSFEELRFTAPVTTKTTESVMVTSNNDGTFIASWIPNTSGFYRLSVSIDGHEIHSQAINGKEDRSDILIIQAVDAASKKSNDKNGSKIVPRGSTNREFLNRQKAVSSENLDLPASLIPKDLRKRRDRRSLIFIGKSSGGLRIRSLPSMTSTQIGLIPPSSVITFIHEVQNEDGVWVRLSNESLMKFCAPGSDPYHSNTEGYALSFNQHLGQVLLTPFTRELEEAVTETRKMIDSSSQSMSWSSSHHIHSRRKKKSKDKERSHYKSSRHSSREQRVMNKMSSLNGCPDMSHAILSSPSGQVFPCQYKVVNTGSCGHNVRAGPGSKYPAIGMVIRGNVVTAICQITKFNESWLKLSEESKRHFCLPNAGEAWTLCSATHPITLIPTNYLLPEINRGEEQDQGIFQGIQNANQEVDIESESDQPVEDASEEDNNRFESPDTEYITDDEENIAVMKSPETETRKIDLGNEGVTESEVKPVGGGDRLCQDEKSLDDVILPASLIQSTATTTSGFCSGTNNASLSSSRVSGSSQLLMESMTASTQPQASPIQSSNSKVAEYKKMFSQYFSSLESGVSSLANIAKEKKADLPSLSVSVKEMVSSLSQSRESLSSLPAISSSSGVQHFTNFSGDFGMQRKLKGVLRTSSLREAGNLPKPVTERRKTISNASDDAFSSDISIKRNESAKAPPIKPRSKHLPPTNMSSQSLQRSSTFTSRTSDHRPLVGPSSLKLTAPKKSFVSLDVPLSVDRGPEVLKQKMNTTSLDKTEDEREVACPVPQNTTESSKKSSETESSTTANTKRETTQEALQSRSITKTTSPRTVKNAMSNSMAESMRAVFAAFVWHEGILHDCIAAASFLKFNDSQRLSKDSLLTGRKLERIYNKFLRTELASKSNLGVRRQKNQRVTDLLTRQQKAKYRHSLDVLRTLKSSCNESFLNANFILPIKDETPTKMSTRKVIQEEELVRDKEVADASLEEQTTGNEEETQDQAKELKWKRRDVPLDKKPKKTSVPLLRDTDESVGDNDDNDGDSEGEEDDEDVPETLFLLLLIWEEIVKACIMSIPHSNVSHSSARTQAANVPMNVGSKKQKNYETTIGSLEDLLVQEAMMSVASDFTEAGAFARGGSFKVQQDLNYIDFPGSILSPASPPRREHMLQQHLMHPNRLVSMNDFRDSSSSQSSDRLMSSAISSSLDALQGNNLNSQFLEQHIQTSARNQLQRNNILSQQPYMMNHQQVNLFGEAALANQAVVRRNNNKDRNAVSSRILEHPSKIECELCGFVPDCDKSVNRKKITHHMREEHPGCGNPCEGRGYNSLGEFCTGWSGSCGSGGVSGITDWYLMCDRCRVKYLISRDKRQRSQEQEDHDKRKEKSKKKSSKISRRNKSHHILSNTSAQINSGVIPSNSLTSSHEVHLLVKENALFLLRLSSAADCLANSSVMRSATSSSSSLPSSSQVSRRHRVSNQEDNLFPHQDSFFCLESFGFPFSKSYQQRIAEETLTEEEIRAIQSGRESQESSPRKNDDFSPQDLRQEKKNTMFARSVSIGWKEHNDDSDEKQASPLKRTSSPIPRLRAQSSEQRTSCTSPSHVVNPAVSRIRGKQESYNQGVVSSSLLSHPSKSLSRLMNLYFKNLQDGESRTSFAISSPVLSFVRDQHDLESLTKDMKTSVRKACCRTFALQGMTWLLRSVTQPTALHDIMWSFVAALDPISETCVSPQGKDNLLKSTSIDDPKSGELDDLKKSDGLDPAEVERESSPVKRSYMRHEEVVNITSFSQDASQHPLNDIVSAGEETCDNLRKSFHSFLTSVSDLMLLLPQGSPLQTIAMKSFYLDFDSVDHSFLHSCHVFSNISKILSRSDDDANEVSNSFPTSPFKTHHRNLNMPSSVIVESLSDITPFLEIKTSSRPAMIASLIDKSTETFWESGDEDKHKRKVVTVTVPNEQVSPRVIYLHVDNVRDSGSKTSIVTIKVHETGLTDSSSLSLDFIKLLSQDLDIRFCGWISTMIPSSIEVKSIKIELKGPDNNLRLRQLTVLGFDATKAPYVPSIPSAFSIYQSNCEAETLKVFRLLTSQVFGKLINPALDDSSEIGKEVMASSPRSNFSGGDIDVTAGTGTQSSDLREHMVGILFSRSSKFSLLQKQVCSLIVAAIRVETQRLREEWEVSLCSPSSPTTVVQGQHHDFSNAVDSYCFEMLSMVLALSGSSIGRCYLSEQEGLLSDLLSLLHTSTARVQRQVVSLLRRVLPEIKPSFLASLLNVKRLPRDPLDVIAKDSDDTIDDKSIGLLDILLSCVAKALTVQTKSRGSNHSQTQGKNRTTTTVTLATCIHPKDDCVTPDKRWFLKGCMSRKMAEMVITLLKDMASGKLGDKWTSVTRNAVCESILNLTKLSKELRSSPNEVIRNPVLWLSLSSLCLLKEDDAQHLSTLHLKPKKKVNVSGGADGNGNDDSIQESQVSFFSLLVDVRFNYLLAKNLVISQDVHPSFRPISLMIDSTSK
jgi:hypothetical protein